MCCSIAQLAQQRRTTKTATRGRPSWGRATGGRISLMREVQNPSQFCWLLLRSWRGRPGRPQPQRAVGFHGAGRRAAAGGAAAPLAAAVWRRRRQWPRQVLTLEFYALRAPMVFHKHRRNFPACTRRLPFLACVAVPTFMESPGQRGRRPPCCAVDFLDLALDSLSTNAMSTIAKRPAGTLAKCVAHVKGRCRAVKAMGDGGVTRS